MGLVENSLSTESLYRLDSIEVHLPGEGIFFIDKTPDVVVDINGNKHHLDQAFRALAERIGEWLRWLDAKPKIGNAGGLDMFPQFLSIRPVFEEYTLDSIHNLKGRTFTWDPVKTSLGQFRSMAARLLTDKHDEVDPESLYIVVSQGDGKTGLKPFFLVSPTLDEEEWRLMARMIVEPKVHLALTQEDQFPRT